MLRSILLRERQCRPGMPFPIGAGFAERIREADERLQALWAPEPTAPMLEALTRWYRLHDEAWKAGRKERRTARRSGSTESGEPRKVEA